jgi:hypothetical protein
MRAFSKSGILLLALFPSGPSLASPPRCPSGLAPVATVPVSLPPRLHNEFVGTVVVAFVINPAGQAVSPTIVSTNLRPVGHGSRTPVGYDGAILSALGQWRYPSRAQACRHQASVAFEFDDSLGSAAGRSNTSFKVTRRPVTQFAVANWAPVHHAPQLDR